MSSGSPPTLWWLLIVGCRLRARLDHVGIERALHQERAPRRARARTSSKTRMNSSPIVLRFVSGSVTPARLARKRSAAFTWTSGIRKCRANVSSTCSGSPSRMQPGVDEHAGELIADRAVDQQRRDGRVHAARQRAEHLSRRRPARGSRRPRRSMMFVGVQSGSSPQPSYEEPLHDVVPVRRVGHLGMELHGEQARGPGSSIAAIGIWSVRAVTRNPSGARVTASPWLIQTVSVAGEVAQQHAGAATRAAWCAPYSRCPVAATSPPSARAISWWP